MAKRKNQKVPMWALAAGGGLAIWAGSAAIPPADAIPQPEGKHFKADAHAEPSSRPKVNFGPLSSKYNHLFEKEGNEHGVSPLLLAAQAKQESGFNPRAGSHAGAQGLMQFMPGTARSYGIDPWDPAQAVDGAARMMRDLKAKFGSDELALAAYNAGPGAVQKYKGIPPYLETQKYVRNIMASYRSAGGK